MVSRHHHHHVACGWMVGWVVGLHIFIYMMMMMVMMWHDVVSGREGGWLVMVLAGGGAA